MKENFVYNHPQHKELRRSLRKNSTKAEKILWEELKNKQLNDLKFRRQYGIGRYVVDFYCPELRLALELDGGYHFEDGAQEYDQKREDCIRSFNIHFLRFANDQVYNDLDGVLKEVENTAKKLKNPS